jgi:hypothetical protein
LLISVELLANALQNPWVARTSSTEHLVLVERPSRRVVGVFGALLGPERTPAPPVGTGRMALAQFPGSSPDSYRRVHVVRAWFWLVVLVG